MHIRDTICQASMLFSIRKNIHANVIIIKTNRWYSALGLLGPIKRSPKYNIACIAPHKTKDHVAPCQMPLNKKTDDMFNNHRALLTRFPPSICKHTR